MTMAALKPSVNTSETLISDVAKGEAWPSPRMMAGITQVLETWNEHYPKARVDLAPMQKAVHAAQPEAGIGIGQG